MHNKSGGGTHKPGTVRQAFGPKRKEVGVTDQEEGAPGHLVVAGVQACIASELDQEVGP